MVKNLSKNFTSFFIMFAVIVSILSLSAYAKSIEPYYNNVNSANSNVSVSSSGLMTITNQYSANSSVFTKAVITTYIEKRVLGIFWSRVDIGQPNNKWVDTSYNNTYLCSHSH